MSDSYYMENYLAHYGVPGMRWGKRKGSTSSTSAASTKKSKPILTPEQKADRDSKRAAIALGVTYVALVAGPKIMDLTMRSMGSAALANQARKGKAWSDGPAMKAVSNLSVYVLREK